MCDKDHRNYACGSKNLEMLNIRNRHEQQKQFQKLNYPGSPNGALQRNVLSFDELRLEKDLFFVSIRTYEMPKDITYHMFKSFSCYE